MTSLYVILSKMSYGFCPFRCFLLDYSPFCTFSVFFLSFNLYLTLFYIFYHKNAEFTQVILRKFTQNRLKYSFRSITTTKNIPIILVESVCINTIIRIISELNKFFIFYFVQNWIQSTFYLKQRYQQNKITVWTFKQHFKVKRT